MNVGIEMLGWIPSTAMFWLIFIDKDRQSGGIPLL